MLRKSTFAAIEHDATQKLGVQHVITATAIHYLGEARYRRGEWQVAQGLFEGAHSLRLQVHGARHRWTRYSEQRPADCAVMLGRGKEVASRLKALVAESESHLGKAHPATESLRLSFAAAQ